MKYSAALGFVNFYKNIIFKIIEFNFKTVNIKKRKRVKGSRSSSGVYYETSIIVSLNVHGKNVVIKIL